jgi:hypothetical protein
LNPSTADSTLQLLNEPPEISHDPTKKALLSTGKREMSLVEAQIKASMPHKFKNYTTRLNKLFPQVFVANDELKLKSGLNTQSGF